MIRRRTAAAARRRRLRSGTRSGAARAFPRRLWPALLPLCLLAIGFLLYSRVLPSLSPAPSVRIEGRLQMLSREQLLQNLQPQLQRGFFSLDLQRIRETLARMPWVRSAQALRTWPPGLLLRVEERRPYAGWGEGHYIGRRGNIFPAAAAEPGLPRLRGPEGRERETLSRYRELSPLLETAGLSLRELTLDSPCCWRLRLECGGEIVAGLPAPVADVRRFVEVYRRLAEDSDAALARADLRYPNGLAIAWNGAAPEHCRRRMKESGDRS